MDNKLRERRSKLLYGSIALSAFCLSTLVGWAGIDFGRHWDEPWHLTYKINAWLPQEYGYPSMTYNISHLSIAAHLMGKSVKLRLENSATWQQKLGGYAGSKKTRDFLKIRSRLACLLISQLTVIAVFLIVANYWGWGEASLACVILSFSNEFLYHSRWIAPDTIMAFWSTMTIALTLLSLKRKSLKTLYWAAAFAGLTISTKYTSVFILCPVLASCLMLSRKSKMITVRRCVLLICIAIAVFFLISPGILIEREKFWRTLLPVYNSYTAGHGGYTVKAGIPHLAKSLLYLATQYFSSIMVINILLFAISVWGLISWSVHRTKETGLILLYIILYMGFIFSHVAMIVRNLMVVLPFLAIFTARGIVSVSSRLPALPRKVFATLICAAILATIAVEVDDAIEIREHARDFIYTIRQALQYTVKDCNNFYFIHENIREKLTQQGGLPANVTEDPSEADLVLALSPPAPRDIENSPFVIKRWFGTREVNYRYYNTWQKEYPGMPRDTSGPIIILPEDAKKYGLLE